MGAEVGERPAERGQADDRVEPARRRAHVPDADEVAGALAAGDHHAVTLSAVRPHLHVREALGHRDRSHAGRGDLVTARPELEAHRAHAGTAGRRRALVAVDRRLETLLEQLVDRRLDAVEVRDRGRERELVAVDPLLLPVEHREEGGARRGRVRADPLPGGFADGHQRHAGRSAEALLGAGDADVELPGVGLERDPAERRDAVDQRQRSAGVRDRADRRDVADASPRESRSGRP